MAGVSACSSTLIHPPGASQSAALAKAGFGKAGRCRAWSIMIRSNGTGGGEACSTAWRVRRHARCTPSRGDVSLEGLDRGPVLPRRRCNGRRRGRGLRGRARRCRRRDRRRAAARKLPSRLASMEKRPSRASGRWSGASPRRLGGRADGRATGRGDDPHFFLGPPPEGRAGPPPGFGGGGGRRAVAAEPAPRLGAGPGRGAGGVPVRRGTITVPVSGAVLPVICLAGTPPDRAALTSSTAPGGMPSSANGPWRCGSGGRHSRPRYSSTRRTSRFVALAQAHLDPAIAPGAAFERLASIDP